MSNLVPISVEYNITSASGGEETHRISAKVAVSELPHITSMFNHYFDLMSEEIEAMRQS